MATEFLDYSDLRDFYCSGFDRIEDMNDGNVRLHLYVLIDAERRAATVTFVLPKSTLPDFVIMTIEALAQAGSDVAKLFPLVERLRKH